MAVKRARKAQAVVPDYSEHLVTALLVFLHSAGVGRNAIVALVDSVMRDLEKSNDSANLQELDRATSSAVGAAFHRWFREPEWLNSAGKPRPLKLHGETQSVQSLLQREMSIESARKTAAELPKINLLKKAPGGKFLPTSLHSLIRHNHPYLHEHTAHSVVRFLHTVRDNVATAAVSPPLIERFAYVSAIPCELEREFRDFTNQQGEALIDTVNDWLESKRLNIQSTGSRNTLQAGLHVFAFVAKNEPAK